MTRHTIIEDFDNRDVNLSKGDIVILLENDRYGEKGYGGDKYSSGLEKAGGYYHVMVKTRHGRKVRIPRHILSKDCVQFHCQLCQTPPMSAYRDYVDHMIDAHLRVQLLRGLDMTKKQPACPFPSCHGISWPIVDNLLFHYASHHNVLEKVVMYESELAAQDMRDKVRNKDDIIDSLAKDLEDARKSSSSSGSSRDSKKDSDVRDDIQGAREMRVIMEQMKEEIETLKHKIAVKNSTIKSLKEDYAEVKKDVKDVEKKYDQECRIVQSLKNELKTLESKQESPGSSDVVRLKKRMEDVRRSSDPGHQGCSKDAKIIKESEDGVSSSGTLSPSFKSEEPSTSQEPAADSKEVKVLRNQMEVLKAQVESLKAQNESLQLEIENLQMQNENLKNIIEIGKSTVETAKKISQDLADENKSLKEKEIKLGNDLKASEQSLNVSKVEIQSLQEKLSKSDATNTEEVAKLSGQLKLKEAEAQKLSQELSTMKENLKQEENSKILTELKRDEIKSKLMKCRENCRAIEESKKNLENEIKALLTENKNAAAEIKTLKSHLSSSRAIVVEKAVAKDEINKIKSELTAKTIEVEKANLKMKKMGQQLSSSSGELKSLNELKVNHEVELKELKEKLKTSNKSNNDQSDVISKLKLKEEEMTLMSQKLKSLENSKNELQERLDFYIQQCSEFEKTDSRHQEEILVLQNSIKTSTVENSAKVEKFKETVQTLENATIFYKGQVDTLLEQNETLRKEIVEAKSNPCVKEDKNLVFKYKLKCDLVEELLKKQEKIAAQLRRKDWEIENYQKKLDAAFEAGMTLPSQEDFADMTRKGSVEGTTTYGQDSPVLDLSTRKKEDTNNNNIKKEEKSSADRNNLFLRNRKYSELSDCSNHSGSDITANVPPPASSSDVPEMAETSEDASKSMTNGTESSLKRPNPLSNYGPDPKKPSTMPSQSS